MLVDNTSTSTAGVTGAIRQAAGTTGANFQYLLATAQIESGLNPSRKASTSSATGLFQFIDQTWLGTMKDAGASLGYGKYADAITRTKSGRLFVKDPAMRAEIMGLRKDPTANALMAGAFTKQNAARLRTKIGREPTDGELYMAHFLGAGGASRLITAAARNPNAKAVNLFPRAARANNAIFYDRQGHARTAAQVYGVLGSKLDVARARTSPTPAPLTADAPTAPTAVAPPKGVSGVSAPAAAATAPRWRANASANAPRPLAPPLATTASRPLGPLAAPTAPRLLVPLAAMAPGFDSSAPTPVRTVSYRPEGTAARAPTAPAAAAADSTASAPPAPDAASAIAAPSPDNAANPPAPLQTATFVPGTSPGPLYLDLFRTEARQGASPIGEMWGAPARADAPAAVAATAATAVPPAGNAGDANASSRQAPGAPLNLLGTAAPPPPPRFDRRS